MSGRPLALLFLLLQTTGASQASAEDCLGIKPQPFAGTIAYRAGVLTRSAFGAAFGVASFLQSRILPDLDRGKSSASFQGAAISGASRLPTVRPGCTVLGDSYETLPSMHYAVNIGLGLKLPYGFEVFYAGNVTESLIASDNVGESFAGHLTLLKGLGTGLIAPLMMAVTDQSVNGPQASYYDFVAGVGWGNSWGAIRAGYVGSTGLFLDLGSYKIGINGSAVFDFNDALISYLKGGLGPYSTPIGLTSLFARGSLLSSGPHVDPSTGREIGGSLAQSEWVTIHLEQQLATTTGWGIGPSSLVSPAWGDIEVAMTVRPAVDFFLARATYRGDFFYLSAGVSRPPDLFALGGSHDFRASAEAGLTIYVSKLGTSDSVPIERLPLVSMRIALNEPEMLRLFPMAPGQIVSFHLEFHLELTPPSPASTGPAPLAESGATP